MAFLEYLLAISLSLWTGVKLTIFFKRSFDWILHVHPRCGLDSAILILLLSQLWLEQVWMLQIITMMSSLFSVKMDTRQILIANEERLKALVLCVCIIVSWMTEKGSSILPTMSIFFALTQFLRWPVRLKDYLREARIICGPAYPLAVIGAWLKSSNSLVLEVAALCSSLAAIFFRPDNSEVLTLLRLPVPSSQRRKVCHAVLMLFSLLCITRHILWFQNFPWPLFREICIIVIMSCVALFFGATHTARILVAAVFRQLF